MKPELIQYQKQTKDIQEKETIPPEDRQKNPQQNINKSGPAIYKKINIAQPSGVYLGIKASLIFEKLK